MPNLFICTGEVSGDLQASYLIQKLQQHRSDLTLIGVGGDRMAAAGVTLLRQTTSIGSIGLLEALPFLFPTIWTEWRIRRLLATTSIDLAIMVDYVGLNAHVSRLLKRRGIPTVYYIAPQEWVWSHTPQLTYDLAKSTRLMLAIFPEEARYYEAAGANVRWVGHPLLDILQSVPSREQARQQLGIKAEDIAVMLFPASRIQEVHSIAPTLLETAKLLQQKLPRVKFWMPLSAKTYAPALQRLIEKSSLQVQLLREPSYLAMAAADLVLSKSGTVNLEAAILGIPQVVMYRVSRLTFWVAKNLLKFSIPYMCPANLVQMRPIVPEFLQDEAKPEVMAQVALELLTQPQRRAQLQHDYQQMRLALGRPGVLERAANEIFTLLDSSMKERGH